MFLTDFIILHIFFKMKECLLFCFLEGDSMHQFQSKWDNQAGFTSKQQQQQQKYTVWGQQGQEGFHIV